MDNYEKNKIISAEAPVVGFIINNPSQPRKLYLFCKPVISFLTINTF